MFAVLILLVSACNDRNPVNNASKEVQVENYKSDPDFPEMILRFRSNLSKTDSNLVKDFDVLANLMIRKSNLADSLIEYGETMRCVQNSIIDGRKEQIEKTEQIAACHRQLIILVASNLRRTASLADSTNVSEVRAWLTRLADEMTGYLEDL